MGRGRIAGIDGLRALAACSILVFHVWDSASTRTHGTHGLGFGSLGALLDNTRGGVALFFVLSGFLLYRPWARAVAEKRERPSVARYARNRALRILPLYWALMLLLVATTQQGLLDRPAQAIGDFAFLQNSVPGWEPRDGFTGYGISPAWSLCVEVVFYAVLPLLGWVAYKRRNAWTPVVGMAVLGIAAKVAGAAAGFGAVWSMSFPVHADWFACGMAVACLQALKSPHGEEGSGASEHHATQHSKAEAARGRDSALEGVALVSAQPRRFLAPLTSTRALLVGALLLTLAATKTQSSGLLGFTNAQSLMAVAAAMLLAAIVYAPAHSHTLRFLETSPLRFAGLWSYGIFLWQVPVIFYLRDHDFTRAGAGGFVFNLALVGVVTVALSAATYLLIERPALQFKSRRRVDAPPVPAAP